MNKAKNKYNKQKLALFFVLKKKMQNLTCLSK